MWSHDCLAASEGTADTHWLLELEKQKERLCPEDVFVRPCGTLTQIEVRGFRRTLVHLHRQRRCIALFCSEAGLPAMYRLSDQAIEHFAKGAVPPGGQRQKLSPCL